ncbi:MAG: response regulator transcription factor [Algicola sp.]|nr:response regulator transcription factor [Algicola sp.]
MTLKTLIVDDEPLAHEIIAEYLEDLPHIEVVGQCYLASEALTFTQQHSVDLIFLDINMPKLNGIDFLKILPTKPQVIITSAYQEYALEGFELEVCDYLLKPFRYDRFLKALNKAHKQHQLLHGDLVLTKKNITGTPLVEPEPSNLLPVKESRIFIKVDKKRIQLDLTDIIYLEAYGNYVKVWIGDKSLLTPRTLTSFEKQLDSEDFQRVHKSYIVQTRHIQFIEGNQVHMSNQQTVTLGKNYRHLAKTLT